MARLSLSKSSLTRQTRQLQTFERFLPALDLKRRQLMAERARARDECRDTLAAIAALRERVRRTLPMFANPELALDRLAVLRAVRVGRENRMGTWLPVLEGIDIETTEDRFLSRPHWVDPLTDHLKTMLELRVRLALRERRVELLEEAVRKVTQRVNLFEKVLIPRTRQHLRQIRIHLSDAERAAVVRSKIAKGKRLREGLA